MQGALNEEGNAVKEHIDDTLHQGGQAGLETISLPTIIVPGLLTPCSQQALATLPSCIMQAMLSAARQELE